VVTVIEGRLRLAYLDPPRETIPEPTTPGVIAPEEPHEVEPFGPPRFFVELHKA
jgi:hypothetical protein